MTITFVERRLGAYWGLYWRSLGCNSPNQERISRCTGGVCKSSTHPHRYVGNPPHFPAHLLTDLLIRAPSHQVEDAHLKESGISPRRQALQISVRGALISAALRIFGHTYTTTQASPRHNHNEDKLGFKMRY